MKLTRAKYMTLSPGHRFAYKQYQRAEKAGGSALKAKMKSTYRHQWGKQKKK